MSHHQLSIPDCGSAVVWIQTPHLFTKDDILGVFFRDKAAKGAQEACAGARASSPSVWTTLVAHMIDHACTRRQASCRYSRQGCERQGTGLPQDHFLQRVSSHYASTEAGVLSRAPRSKATLFPELQHPDAGCTHHAPNRYRRRASCTGCATIERHHWWRGRWRHTRASDDSVQTPTRDNAVDKRRKCPP